MTNKKYEQERLVNTAFDAQSDHFDTITNQNPMEVLYRQIVREHVLAFTNTGETMLELNCGTGLDAVFFAGKGLKVLATDNSEGMLEQLKQKADQMDPVNRITFQKCSFNDLSVLGPNKKFRHVFSNFGGLNCAAELDQVINQVDNLLVKGGMAHFVLITPICLWELGAVLKGRFSYAFRRLSKHGTKSQIDGHYFTTYYYSARKIKKWFGKNYRVTKLRSLGCFLPPTFKSEFPLKWPGLFRVLKTFESRLNTQWPFNRVGDLYIISLKKNELF